MWVETNDNIPQREHLETNLQASSDGSTDSFL